MRHQGVVAVNQVGDTTVVKLSLLELQANWQMGANTARREGFPGVCERTENDLVVFADLKRGDIIVIE